MSVATLEFLLPLFVISAFFFWLPSDRLRRSVLALLNAGFLWTWIPNSWSWLALGLFLLSGYAVSCVLAAKPSALLFAVYLVVLVSAFVLLKSYGVLWLFLPESLLRHPVRVVGLSYMLFRQIHFLVDRMQSQIASVSLWRYLNYQLNVFALMSGPIQRYQDFERYWEDPRPLLVDRVDVLKGYMRILWGCLELAVVGAGCLWLYEEAVASTHWSAWRRVPAIFYAYPAYVFFNFAGYCSIVIGAASLLGLRLPENFNRPYVARNMIDYWNRWHMTLSLWLRDYLFMPMYKALAGRWRGREAVHGPLCFLVVFVIAGAWHGPTANFIVFGLLNGVGVSAAKAWENMIVRRRGRSGLKEYMRSRRIAVLARLVTFHFACSTFLFFPAGFHKCLAVIRSFFPDTPVP